MTTEELIEQNNELRGALNEENDAFYTDFLLYVRSQSIFKEEHTTEEQLFSILQDILEAQKNGQSAADYFGTDPKFVADKMLAATPSRLAEGAKLFLYGIGAYFAFNLVPDLIVPGKPLDLGAFILSGLYLSLVAILVLNLIGRTIYFFKKSTIPSWAKKVMTFTGAIALLAPVTFINMWVHTPAKLNLDGTVGIFVIILVLIGVTIFVRKQEKKEESHIWRPILFFVVISAVIGILTRLPILEGLLLSKAGRLTLAGIVLVVLIIFNVYTVFTVKKMDKKD